MLRYLFLKIILFAVIFKSSIFLIFFCVQPFVILVYSIWTWAILIMYLFNLEILIYSNCCFKFVKSCIAPCNAVNSGCLLKGLVTFGSCFVFINRHTCWRHKREYSDFSFVVSPARAGYLQTKHELKVTNPHPSILMNSFGLGHKVIESIELITRWDFCAINVSMKCEITNVFKRFNEFISFAVDNNSFIEQCCGTV